jgi:hypothetical protein
MMPAMVDHETMSGGAPISNHHKTTLAANSDQIIGSSGNLKSVSTDDQESETCRNPNRGQSQ